MGLRLLSQATVLFNKPARGLLPTFSREPILFENDDNHYATLIKRQPSAGTDKDTHGNIPLHSTQSPLAVQHKDRRPWMHWMIGGFGSNDHSGRSYKTQVTKTECIITRMRRHFKATSDTAEDYLRKISMKTECCRQLIKSTNMLLSLQSYMSRISPQG